MVESLLNFYSWAITNKIEKQGLSRHYYGFMRIIAMKLGQLLIPILLKRSKDKYRLECRAADAKTPRVIVSLTTFPARINVVWIVVELLMRQRVKPDKVVLYLSKDQFDSVESLPENLRQLSHRGLEIRLVDGDLRSHKKYHYAMIEYPNDIIITVDDDIFYPNYLVDSLLGTHEEYPKCVVSNRIHTLTFDTDNKLAPYNKWGEEVDNDGYNHLQTGVSGVLYPPPHGAHGGVLYKDILDKELAMRLTPAGDDLWLFAMTRLAGNRVIKTPFRIKSYGIRIKNNVKLSKLNCNKNFNDEQIERVRQYYIETIGIDPFENKES